MKTSNSILLFLAAAATALALPGLASAEQDPPQKQCFLIKIGDVAPDAMCDMFEKCDIDMSVEGTKCGLDGAGTRKLLRAKGYQGHQDRHIDDGEGAIAVVEDGGRRLQGCTGCCCPCLCIGRCTLGCCNDPFVFCRRELGGEQGKGKVHQDDDVEAFERMLFLGRLGLEDPDKKACLKGIASLKTDKAFDAIEYAVVPIPADP